MPSWMWIVLGLVVVGLLAFVIYVCVARPGLGTNSTSPLEPSSASSTGATGDTGSTGSNGGDILTGLDFTDNGAVNTVNTVNSIAQPVGLARKDTPTSSTVTPTASPSTTASTPSTATTTATATATPTATTTDTSTVAASTVTPAAAPAPAPTPAPAPAAPVLPSATVAAAAPVVQVSATTVMPPRTLTSSMVTDIPTPGFVLQATADQARMQGMTVMAPAVMTNVPVPGYILAATANQTKGPIRARPTAPVPTTRAKSHSRRRKDAPPSPTPSTSDPSDDPANANADVAGDVATGDVATGDVQTGDADDTASVSGSSVSSWDSASDAGSTTSVESSQLSQASQALLDCQNAALDALQACQAAAGSNTAALNACWQQIHTQLSSCVPTTSSPTGVGMILIGAAAIVFNDNVPISDRLDMAIENYLACMDSDNSANDRQSCVEQLFTDINNSVNLATLTPDQQTGFADAQTALQDCLQQSTSIQQDFLCLRTFYGTVVDDLQLPLLPVAKKAKRVFATNKAVATNCYQQATSTLRQCLDSIKTIADPTQREQARQQCLKEYRELLQTCLCMSYPSHPGCAQQ